MKSLLLMITFLLATLTIQAQEHGDSLTDIINDLERRVSLHDSIINEIKSFKSSQEEIFKQTSETIGNQNSVISGFGGIYTVLTILISLITIGIPIITFLLFYRIDDRLNKKVATYLKTERREKFDKYARDLYSVHDELVQKAVDFFYENRLEDFSDNHLSAFLMFVTTDHKGKLNSEIEMIVSILVSCTAKQYANRLFNMPEVINKDFFSSLGLQYIVRNGVHNFIPTLKEFLGLPTPASLGTLLRSIKLYSSFDAKVILDNKELVDSISEIAWNTYKVDQNSLGVFREIADIPLEDLKSTYFGIKVISSKEIEVTT